MICSLNNNIKITPRIAMLLESRSMVHAGIILARETKLTKKDVLEILPESHPPYQTFNALCFILWLEDENYNFRVK